VQFVCFETTLDKDGFFKRWEEYQKSANNEDVTFQQCEGEQTSKYIAQHHCNDKELRFVFSKADNRSRIRRELITVKQAGGYTILQLQRSNESRADESKIFVFFTSPRIDLDAYRQIAFRAKLNIYEAYYENCSYSYILEFFMKDKNASELLQEIKKYNPAEFGIYKEFALSTI